MSAMKKGDQLLAAAEALLAAKDNGMETSLEWQALRRAVARARRANTTTPNPSNAIPNTTFVIGQRIHCQPLGEDGHIVGYENDGFILIVDLVRGGTEHLPAGDCRAR